MVNKKLNIVISAYACSPNWGSEPGMAWNWVKNLSDYYNIYLITSTEFKEELLEGVVINNLESSIKIYFNDIGKKATMMGKNQGDWRFYYYYRKWQKKTYKIALNIIKKNDIVLVHQLNMIGFREPGYLWKLDKPSIWGPIGGMSPMPLGFIENSQYKLKIKYILKNYISDLQLIYSPRIKKAINSFNYIITASNNSKIKTFYKREFSVLNETGCDLPIVNNNLNRFDSEELDILWVGRNLYTKKLDLALEIISQLKKYNIKLHIVGIDDYNLFQDILEKLDIKNQLIWHGKVPHKEISKMMRNFQLFLFTSVVEGTPHVILEAIENSLPIICFDTCGQGECVNEYIGIKIELSNPKKAVCDFTDEIIKLYNDRNKLKMLSKNSAKRARELSWSYKTCEMLNFYQKGMKNNDK